MENKYFDTEYNVQTDEYIVTPWTQEKIDIYEKAIADDLATQEASKPTVEQLQAQLADIASQLQALQK